MYCSSINICFFLSKNVFKYWSTYIHNKIGLIETKSFKFTNGFFSSFILKKGKKDTAFYETRIFLNEEMTNWKLFLDAHFLCHTGKKVGMSTKYYLLDNV